MSQCDHSLAYLDSVSGIECSIGIAVFKQLGIVLWYLILPDCFELQLLHRTVHITRYFY